jgi:hypothetical protein
MSGTIPVQRPPAVPDSATFKPILSDSDADESEMEFPQVVVEPVQRIEEVA